MKICPNCKKQYADDVAFCLDDGTVLEIPERVSEAETVALPAEEVTHVAETIDRFGTSVAQNFARDTESSGLVAETTDRLAPTVMSRTDDSAVADYTENPLLGWLVPLIIVLILIILGFMFCSKSAAPAAVVTIIINN